MKSHGTNISFTIHRLVTLTLIVGMLIFPIISLVTSSDDMNKNFIELHDEKDTSENEKLEENSKNEKKDFQPSLLDLANIINEEAIKNYGPQNLKNSFIFEIPIPPPDTA